MKRLADAILRKNLPAALPKEMRSPSNVVTLIPVTRLPRVPCKRLLSMNAKYGNAIKILIETNVRKIPGKSVAINMVGDSGHTQLKKEVYLSGNPKPRFTR